MAPKSNVSTDQIAGHPSQSQNHTNGQSPSLPWKLIPPCPKIKVNVDTSIVITWTMDELTDKHAEVVSYQIYSFEETPTTPSPPSPGTLPWQNIGNVDAMLLPMVVTLSECPLIERYHFAVRAVDKHGRFGGFSLPETWT